MRRAFLLVALLTGCAESEKRVEPRAPLDPEVAREAVLSLTSALERGDREGVRRALSLGDLARATRPDSVPGVTRATEAAFSEEALSRLLAPDSPARRVMAGIQLGEATAQGEEGIVQATSVAGPVRFVVARRDGQLRVVRIE